MRHPAPRGFESLEPRLAMAGLVTFADVDGDTVTVRTNRGTDAQLGAALTLAPTGTLGGYQLRQVALGGPVFAGTNLTITARPSAIGGDGQVDVGEIVTALDLGRVTVAGDLGRIIAGNANLATPGVAALTVVSIGQRGTVTGAPNFETVVIGPVPTIRVAGNLVARFAVGGRAADVVIGGSIAGVLENDGFEAGSIGRMIVGGNVFGGSANGSGRVYAYGGGIDRLVIRGDVVGGSGGFSGALGTAGRIGFARIGGSLLGGGNTGSGSVFTGSAGINRLVVGGNIVGGSGTSAGGLQAYGPVGSIAVGGSIQGADGPGSGVVYAAAGLGTIEIGAKLRGGLGAMSGQVVATRIGTLRVDRILAGDGPESGGVRASSLGTVVVRGDILGSTLQPAIISAVGAATPTGPRAIGSLTVGGSMNNAVVLGGYAAFGLTAVNGAARIGAVVVRGNMTGSSIVAGVENIGAPHPSGLPQFGDGLDVPVAGRRGSRIDSLVVNGLASGSADVLSFSGVLANSIGTVRLGGRPYTVTSAGITPTSPNLQFRLIN